MLPSSHLDFFEKYDRVFSGRQLNLAVFEKDYNFYPDAILYHYNGILCIMPKDENNENKSEDFYDFVYHEFRSGLSGLVGKSRMDLQSMTQKEGKYHYSVDLLSHLIRYYTLLDTLDKQDEFYELFESQLRSYIKVILIQLKPYLGDDFNVHEKFFFKEIEKNTPDIETIKVSITVEEFALLIYMLTKQGIICDEPFNKFAKIYRVISSTFSTHETGSKGMSFNSFKNFFENSRGNNINHKYTDHLKKALLQMGQKLLSE
ncbi:MAG: hypothetical protein KBC43_07235 [Bacteroidales bacterium]|nr:hypothetical protein [Bacteroidales bacterium]